MRWEWRLTPELQRQLVVFAGLVALLAVGYWWLSAPSSTATVPVARVTTVASAPASVVVDIEGAVRRPGVIRLRAGARVIDAITAAGGLREGQRAVVNMARPLVDGEQIVIGASAASAPVAGGSAAASGRVDINTASVAQLDALPGIGAVLAQRIVDHREQHGPFKALRDLLDVSGIGDAKYADLADAITIA